MPQISVKEEIVDAATSTFRELGYHGASIQTIAAAAGVPKGSVYNHFTSKVELAQFVVRRYAAGTSTQLLLGGGRAVDRIRLHLETEIARTQSTGLQFGCLLGNMSAESGDNGLDALRSVVETSFDQWVSAVAATVAEAQANGEVVTTSDPKVLAGLFVDGLEGATLRSKTLGSTAPLDSFVQVVFDTLLV